MRKLLAIAVLAACGCSKQTPTPAGTLASSVAAKNIVAEKTASTATASGGELVERPENAVLLDPQTLAMDSDLQRKACQTNQMAANYVSPSESDALVRVPGAKRQGKVLKVGRETFTDNTVEDAEAHYEKYQFIGRLTSKGPFVVEGKFYETTSYTLIGPDGRKMFSLWGVPVPSTDGSIFAAEADDESDEFLDIADKQNGVWREFLLETGNLCGLKWASENEFHVLENKDPEQPQDRAQWVDLRVYRGKDGGWIAVGPDAVTRPFKRLDPEKSEAE